MSKPGVPWTDEEREIYLNSEKYVKNIELFKARSRLPKTKDHRDNIAAANKGVLKSDEHKSNMSQTQKRRQELKKQILQSNPLLPLPEVWEKVKELL